MNAANRITPADRNRAVARLRALTIGTTIAGVAAAGAFGTLAAVSYSGHATGATADVGGSTTSDSSGTTTSASKTATPTATPTIQPATTTITTTTGGGQVSSGGS
jgi:hypothetical protein